jgi:hypothetical protein
MLKLLFAPALVCLASTSALALNKETLKLYAVGDQEIMLRRGISLDTACTPTGPIKIAIIRPPRNGKLTERSIKDFPAYAKDSIRFGCNKKQVDAMAAYYKANPGFKGKDQFEFAIVYYDGDASRYHVEITVW